MRLRLRYCCALLFGLLAIQLAAQPQFTENLGQWPDQVRYRVQLIGGAFWAEKDRFTLEFVHPDDWNRMFGHGHGEHVHDDGDELPRMRKHTYQMVFEGANPEYKIITGKQYEGYKNYFIGPQENWASGVRSFHSIIYQDIYPGVMLHVTERDGHLKYSFMLGESVDPSIIRIRYEHVDDVSLQIASPSTHERGSLQYLLIKTSVNEVIESGLYAFQPVSYTEYRTKDVPCIMKLNGNVLTFEFPDGYDDTMPLTIDPTLTFSSYTGSTADNFGFTAAPDTAKNLVAGGIVFAQGYPLTPGAYDQTWNGGVDVGITKFTADGTNLIYSTYIGGSGDETPNSIIVNSKDELIIFGITGSSDFPTTVNAFDNTFAGGPSATFIQNGTTFPSGTDMYLAKLSADGTQLLGSTYIGGSQNDGLNNILALRFNYGDQFRGEVVVDPTDNIYVASCTPSVDFPATFGSYQVALAGGQDGCVLKLSPDLSTLTWASFLGGTGNDASYGLKVRPDGSVVVAGGTTSLDFPTTLGGLNSAPLGGLADGYLALLSASGAALVSGTYLGTSGHDQCYFVEIDDGGGVYTYGQAGPGYPVTAGVYNNANSGQFITKLNSTLSAMAFSTVFGKSDGNPEISPTAFLVDKCQNVYCSGWGGTTNSGNLNTDLNISGMPLTPDAYQSTTDGSDFYFIVLSRDATNLLYATYFGGNQSSDHVDGGTSRFDAEGIIYEAVCASCGFATSDFPTTPGAWSSTDQSSIPQANCNMAVIKLDFQLVRVSAYAEASPSTTGCTPFTVNFSSGQSTGDVFEWDFGDGNFSTQPNPTHTYTSAGVYTVQLIASDTLICSSSDTTTILVSVIDSLFAEFAAEPSAEGCAPFTVTFSRSTPAGGVFQWDFGDGNTSTDPDPSHTYSSAGTYQVGLIAADTSGCGIVDTSYLTIVVHQPPNLIADQLPNPPEGCAPLNVHFLNSSTPGYPYQWNFDDGGASSLTSPTHTFTSPGSYQVRLIVLDTGFCQAHDTAYSTVVVYPVAKAAFTFSPLKPNPDTAVSFTNHSTNASSYLWDFGDGSTSMQVNPEHSYDEPGEYLVCLTAFHPNGCNDSVCQKVEARDIPVIDVPTAFSPNRDNINDMLYVRGHGVERLDFRLYNRWGQLIFTTSDLSIGWDGTYKGVEQEMEVYIYTLDATLDNGGEVYRKGNITLIR